MIDIDPPVETEKLKCEFCDQALGAETLDEYNYQLSQHILDHHKDVASAAAIKSAELMTQHYKRITDNGENSDNNE